MAKKSAKPKVIHVCPAWTQGPRTFHPKFGGPVIGGTELVEDRLRAIKKRFPEDRSSGHNFLEVCVAGPYEKLNKPGAISYEHLVAGIESGEFPEWSAMTSPAFGLKGVELGAILSEDPRIREFARQGHLTAIKRSKELKKRGLGLGYTIWWPATDSRLHRGPLATIEWAVAWKQLVDFWISILEEIPEEERDTENGDVVLEYKPSVPGELDFIPTMTAAIAFCEEVNERLGRKAMVINLEFAHALIGGQPVKSAVKQQIAAGMYCGFVHANSAMLAIIKWNNAGTKIEAGTPGDDADWAVGEGGKERWEDQQEAVALMAETGLTIVAEHDIDPAGENPLECYARSRANLETMLKAA